MSTKTVIIIASIVFLFVIINYIQSKRYDKKMQQLNDSRPHLTREEYIDRLTNKGFDRQHVEVVHDEIRAHLLMNDFSIYPEDNIHKVYGIVDLDDIQLMDDICKKLKLREVMQYDIDEVEKTLKVFNAEFILALTKRLSI